MVNFSDYRPTLEKHRKKCGVPGNIIYKKPWELLLYRNLKHSSALVNLHVYSLIFFIVFLCPVYRVRLCVH